MFATVMDGHVDGFEMESCWTNFLECNLNLKNTLQIPQKNLQILTTISSFSSFVA